MHEERPPPGDGGLGCTLGSAWDQLVTVELNAKGRELDRKLMWGPIFFLVETGRGPDVIDNYGVLSPPGHRRNDSNDRRRGGAQQPKERQGSP